MQEAALEAAPQIFLSPASPLLLAAPLPHLFILFLSRAGLLPAELGLPGPARRAGPIIVSAARLRRSRARRRPPARPHRSGLARAGRAPGSPLPRARFRAPLAAGRPGPAPGPRWLLRLPARSESLRDGPSCPQTRPSPLGLWLRLRNGGGPAQGIGGRGHTTSGRSCGQARKCVLRRGPTPHSLRSSMPSRWDRL